MSRLFCPGALIAPAGFRGLAFCALAALLAAGCGHGEKTEYQSIATPPTVDVIKPQARTIIRSVGQPSFVEAYERTSIYPKVTAYIDKWRVDIGDKVQKDDVLATLFVPELVEDYETKRATVELDKERVDLAEQVVKVAEADVKAADARLLEAKEILGKYESEVDRWETEVQRLKREVDRGVVDPQILLESTNQWKSSVAARDAAIATIKKADAELLSAREQLRRDQVDVSVAKADLAVATSEWKRLGAMVGYLTLRAPFEGVVVERNANTFDFVLPSTGDPTANKRAPHVSATGASPIYVIERTDIVRIFVDIPERDANYVHGVDLRLVPAMENLNQLPRTGRDLAVVARAKGKGPLHFRVFDSQGKVAVDADEAQLAKSGDQLAALKEILAPLWEQPSTAPTGVDADGVWEEIPGSAPEISPLVKDNVLTALRAVFGTERIPFGSKASVLVRGYRDEPIEGTVTRTSWSLNVTSRTLRAEIDLPNPGGQLLPGMYAYADILIERPNVHALPETALTRIGDKTYCWLYRDGKAQRVEVRTGISDGEWVEVTNLERAVKSKNEHPWTPFTGSEDVITGDLTILSDGAPVQIAPDGQEVAARGKSPAQPL